MKMVVSCLSCGFSFYGKLPVCRCPSCGGFIRFEPTVIGEREHLAGQVETFEKEHVCEEK